MPVCSQSVISSARRSAKAEARGANPRESASFKAPVPQKQKGEFRKLVFVGASPTRGSIFQGRDVTVSISACDADCAGANPVALTILDGPKLIVYPHHKEGVPSVAKALAVRVRFPAWSASVRSRHLSILSYGACNSGCPRIRRRSAS